MATIAQIERGAMKYIDNDMAENIPTNIPHGQIKKILALSGAAYAVTHGLENMLAKPELKNIGAVDVDGNVDINGIAEVLLTKIPKEGFILKFPILGDLKFFAEDVERLRAYIMEG